MRSRDRLVALITLLLTLAPSGAASQPPPVFGASADIVLIDLVATDDDGRLVTDLKADEIQVREGGKPQRIEFVRFVSTRETAAERAPGAAAASPAGSPTAAGSLPETHAAEGFLLVVVVDLATMPADVLARTREAIVRMARTGVEPGTRVMLVVLERGLRVAQPFTTDLERFAAAAEALKPTAADGEAAMAEFVDEVDATCDGAPGALQNAIGLGRAFIENARHSMSTALEGISGISRYLAPLPGRKHLVYYSAGYPMNPAEIASTVIQGICQGQSSASLGSTSGDVQSALRIGGSVDSTGLLQAFVDEANRAQVSVYSVDARGLMGDMISARSRVPARLARSGSAQEVQRKVVRAPQEILRSMAEDTGGTASVNTNELSRGMKAAVADARGYYLVAYAPAGSRKEGRYYPIALEVARKGLRLRYRRGYEWLSDAKRIERALAGALRFPGLYAEDGLTVEPWVENGRLHAAVILPTRSLVFRRQGGEYLNEITVQGLLRDETGRPVGDRFLFNKQVALKLPEVRWADLVSRENLEIANDAPAPNKGLYQLAVVVSHSNGRLASATVNLEAP